MGRFIQVALGGSYARDFRGTAKRSNRRPPAHWGNDPRYPTMVWDVALTFDGRKMTTPFYMGPAHAATPPDPCDVLESLLSDASMFDNESYGDWAADLGLDPDTAAARKTYKAVERQTGKLRRFLGEAYEDVLYHEDLKAWCAGQRHVP